MFSGTNVREQSYTNESMRPSIMESEGSLMQNTGEQQTQEAGESESIDYNQQPYDYGQASQQGEYANQGQQTQDYSQQQYSGGYGQADYGVGQYQPYQEAMSSDIITEISEQVVEDKLSGMREKMEKAINFGNIAESRIMAVDKRLKRIEQIIDTLQISLLQRVSEYVTDIKDIKNEIEETHKTMKGGHHQVHHTGQSAHHTTHHSMNHKGKKHTP